MSKKKRKISTGDLPPHPPAKKKTKGATRGKSKICVICGIKLRTTESVCFKWRCQYDFSSERAAYWLGRAGEARLQLNMSRDVHVDDSGIGQLSGSCKICDKLISVGCGEKCVVLCPWCVCDTSLCRNRVYKKFQWFNTGPRRCFAKGCAVVIPSHVMSVFGTDNKAVSLSVEEGEFISCMTCRDSGHPTVYCADHNEHYYHDWDSWLPKRRKKPTTKAVVQLSPYSLPPVSTLPILPILPEVPLLSSQTPQTIASIFDSVDLSTLEMNEDDIFDIQIDDF